MNVVVNVAVNNAYTIREITATIPATKNGHLIKISKMIEKMITKSNPTNKPTVSILKPPFHSI